jgi:ABC-type multidrug transport system ATPase subunit
VDADAQEHVPGEKRRLDVVMGLIHDPTLLFLDEPTIGLDPQARANLWEHIEGLRSRNGATVFLTTHYLDEADALADRILIIDQGRIVASDTADNLRRRCPGTAWTSRSPRTTRSLWPPSGSAGSPTGSRSTAAT